MKILSLFDGISCGRLALERAGIPVEKYYASEIDKYAIQIAQKNYPDTECIMINSALLSAQQRKRYYWTNWHVEQPQDKGILLKDILESGDGVDVSQYGTNWHKTTDKASTLMARDYKGFGNQCQTGVAVPCALRTREDETGKYKRLETKDDNKANSLTSVQTDSMVVVNIENYFRKYGTKGKIMSPETKKTQCLTASMGCGGGNNPLVAEPIRVGQIGKGGQGDRIYSVRGKSVCLNANGGGRGAKTGLYKVDLPDGDYIIRKLTPVECERLQTLPDNWTAGVSNTQRYKAIGNGWTVDVIAWIFGQLPQE